MPARIFFDYDRVEYYDEENSIDEDRYNVIGDVSAGLTLKNSYSTAIIGNVIFYEKDKNVVLFVVYTERTHINGNGSVVDVIRLISARAATSFERGLYYGRH